MTLGFHEKLLYLIATGDMANKKAEIRPIEWLNHLLPIKYNKKVVKTPKSATKMEGPTGLYLKNNKNGETK